LLLSASFLGYGVYLNETSNSHIETMLAERAVGLSGIEVSYRDIRPELYLDYIGLRAGKQADVIAEIEGLIEEIYVSQGQEVQQGQPLCRLVNPEIPLSVSRADTDIAKAEAAYLQSMSTVQRNERLAAEDAVSASELELSISQMKASKAELDAARIARKQMERQMTSQTVTAPLSGSVTVIYQQAGNFIGKGSPLVMLADFTNMYFTALVKDQKIKNLLPLEGRYTLHTDLTNMTEKAFDSPAKASFTEETAFEVLTSTVAPPLTESVPVRSLTCEIDNRLGVMELGMYTDIVIRKETPKRVLAVPRSAVFEGESPKVYVRDENSRLAVREIKTGVDNADYVEVVEGLGEGDIVIISGVEGLDLGVKVEVDIVEEEM
jgi:RND family efflux transporter MFP subunit